MTHKEGDDYRQMYFWEIEDKQMPMHRCPQAMKPMKPDPEWEEFKKKNKSTRERALFLSKRLLRKGAR